VVYIAIIGLFSIPLLLWRSFRSLRRRLYVTQERKLALKLSKLIEEKCKLLEKVSEARKERGGQASPGQEARFGKSAMEAQTLPMTGDMVARAKAKLEDILLLGKQLKEEKAKRSKQVHSLVRMSKLIQSLEDQSESLQANVAEAETTLRALVLSEAQLKVSITQTSYENSQLQESCKQLGQEAAAWKERVSEVNKQKIAIEDSVTHVEQVLRYKEDYIRSLAECLLKMKIGAFALGGDRTQAGNCELGMASASGNSAHSGDPPARAGQRLMYALELNASIRSLEGQRNQVYIQLREVDIAKEDLTEHLKTLQIAHIILQSKHTRVARENQNLQRSVKRMTELHEEIGLKHYRRLMVENHHREEAEEKLAKVEEKITQAAADLETYKNLARELKGKMERTKQYYQRRLILYKEKAHFNRLVAQGAEKQLKYFKNVNASKRQKLMDMELEFELLHKAPSAFDSSNVACGREQVPCGPSPSGQPPFERQVFLSPLLLRGSLSPPPLSPHRGGKGSRSPENPLFHQVAKEGVEPGYGNLPGPWRAPPDPRFLPPPCQQEVRLRMPPSRPLYTEPALPPQRQDTLYSNSGQPRGPAELRNFNMPSWDKEVSSKKESRSNDTKSDLDNRNVPEAEVTLPAESKAAGPGFAPPIRGPWLPVDPRSHYLAREPRFPPPPVRNVPGASGSHFPARDFPGPPHPPFPPRGFPNYLPPRAGCPPPGPPPF
jgi:hypothetical protein